MLGVQLDKFVQIAMEVSSRTIKMNRRSKIHNSSIFKRETSRGRSKGE